MSRKLVQEESVSVRLGDAKLKDPLVINFTGAAVAVTETKFSFDIDIDGAADQIATLSSNSGFLALDKNSDGVVNDGSELFGPATGSGFAELAQYDGDGNHWIDENDSIFAQLRIWSRDAAGNNSLLTLGEVGVGAIYLGNVATQFDLKTASAELLGQIQSSGIYLKEDGTAGTVQELDIVAQRQRSADVSVADYFIPSQIGANCSKSMTPVV